MGPGLRLTKLFTVFKTLTGRVSGALGGTTKKSYFSKLGPGPLPLSLSVGVGGIMQGSGAGDASSGERPTQFCPRSPDVAENGHPFNQRVVSEHALWWVML